MPEQFRGDLQEGLTAVPRRPGALEGTQSTSRVAGKSERHHDSARRLVLGLVPFLVCLLFMGSAVSADEALFINPQGLVGIGTADPGEVCIHHLWFTDQDYINKGNFIKWNPAVKTEQDREALWQALLSDKIDVIATDHAPHTKEEKQNKYLQAPPGGPLVQHALVCHA